MERLGHLLARNSRSTTVGISETVLAALIGASATMVTAMFHLVSSFKSQSTDRRVKGSGIKSLLWMLALMLASAVGGFAFAEYRSQETRDETHALRMEMRQQLQTIIAATTRIEQGRGGGADDEGRRGVEGVATVVNLPACKGAQVGFATDHPNCAEQDAVQVSVCTPMPANAKVTSAEFFSRPDDSQQAWSDARVTPGQDIGGGRFAVTPVERPDADGTKQVCYSFAHWNSQKGRTLRVLVKYAM
jgi:hypothetical protein